MCKAVDKGMRIEGLRVVRKEGGTSGVWVEGEAVEDGEGDVPKIRRYEYNKNG
jgi:cyclic pyranopterin phosphate synthase